MKKCAVINDLSGFGKCSLSAVVPVLSVMGIEVHPLPTAVLSNQTDYDSYQMADLTSFLPLFIEEWRKLSPCFNGVLTGFVANERQFDTIDMFLQTFCKEDTLLVVDPVMADNGRLYDNYTENMCVRVRELCCRADVITPNVTELEILSEKSDIIGGAQKLLSAGIQTVIVTGVRSEDKISNYVFTGRGMEVFTADYRKGSFSGTGDLFSAVIAGCMLRGQTPEYAAKTATDFLAKAISSTAGANKNDGVDFELFLAELA